jgi:hypothetical protein
METIIIEFEKVTKYPLTQFLTEYRDFMLNSYPAVNRYFSGETESIDNSHLVILKNLTSKCKDILAQFKNFANKFSTCGYWELMDYIDDLNNTIEKINKLPKFRRTSLTKRGYRPYIQVSGNVGGLRTVEDVANSVKEINKDNTNWIDLMLNNDLNEADWEIDELKPINVFINNKIDIVVTTILDQPIGKRIYGKDINRKITFVYNDLSILEYQDNIEQKSDILLELNRGDVPENMLFGKNIRLLGTTVKQFSYPEIVNNITNNFLQNDLFEYVSVKSFTFENGNMTMTVEIKTKYDYKTEKKIVI